MRRCDARRKPKFLSRQAKRGHSSRPAVTAEHIEKNYDIRLPDKLEFGGIVGVVNVVDCVKRHPPKWKFRGSWGWVLNNPHRLPFRKCKGFVGLFKPRL
jgi:hypothetical protein